MVSKEKARLYKQTGKTSVCKQVPKPTCVSKSTCKYANGKVRQFCRKKYNTRHNRRNSSSATSSSQGLFPVLNLRELKENKRPFRLQPVATRRKVGNKYGLDDWSASSSATSSPKMAKRMMLKPVATRRKVKDRGLNDWGSDE
jgi:hypothetical protein